MRICNTFFAVIMFISIFLLGACTSIKERYLVSSTDGVDQSYYLVTIKGRGYFTSNNFQTGVASSEVLNSFLDSSDLPTSLKNSQNSNPQILDIDPVTGKAPKKGHLVIVYSNDPSAIFQQISTIADAKVTSNAISGIVVAREKSHYSKELEKADLMGNYAEKLKQAVNQVDLSDQNTAETNLSKLVGILEN